jgi:hypothetical protein
MEQEERSSAILRWLGTVAIVVVVIAIVVALIYWVADWSTLYQYGTGLIIGGLMSMVFGLFSVAGGMSSTRSFTYQQAESAGYQTGHERVEESKQNLAETYSSLIILGAAGAVVIVAGLVVRAIAA